MPNVTEIVSNPDAYGFRWSTGETVKSKRTGREYTGAVIPVVTNVAKFDAAFPGLLLRAADGSSIRVEHQGWQRRLFESGAKPTTEELQNAVAARLLGAKMTGPRTRVIEKIVKEKVYEFNGVTYDTETEMVAAVMAHLAEQTAK